MKKKIAIVAAVVIVLILAVIGWTAKKPPATPPSATPTPVPLVSGTAPQQDFLDSSSQEYEIVYDPNYDLYIISVLATPFAKIRSLAEQALLKKLNIGADAACGSVKVHIGSPAWANPDQIAAYDTFSFCPK